jgi:hypothetical protein
MPPRFYVEYYECPTCDKEVVVLMQEDSTQGMPLPPRPRRSMCKGDCRGLHFDPAQARRIADPPAHIVQQDLFRLTRNLSV